MAVSSVRNEDEKKDSYTGLDFHGIQASTLAAFSFLISRFFVFFLIKESLSSIHVCYTYVHV